MKKSEQSTLTPDQIIGIVIRRRWFIIIPFMIAMVVGIYLALTLPRVYEARTLILVEQQRVPTDYVRSVVSIDIGSRINTIRQQIMSRTNLEKIIQQFDLFSEPGQENMFLEDKVEALSRQVIVDVMQDKSRETDAFSISFQGKDPELVARIANSLASFFIDENLKVREAQAIGTSDFLDAELVSMRVRLEAVEENLKQYREANMGELPEQLQTNLSILNRLQDRLVDRQQGLRDEKNRLISLENQIKLLEEQRAVLAQGGPPAAAVPQESEIDSLRRQAADLKTRYTDKHPDVVRIEKKIQDLEKDGAAAAGPAAAETQSPEKPKSLDTFILDYRRQQADLQREISVIEGEISDLMSQIQFYQERVENTPKREQELLTLNRDYENIQATYNSLLGRKLEAEISVNMEKKQKGEQFRMLDSARVPERPVKPDLKKIFLMVIAAGFGVGGGIIFLLEYSNTSFKKPEDVEGYLGLPVLATIPRLIYAGERRLKKINTVLSIVAIGASLALFAGFAVLTFNGVEQTLALLKRVIR